MIKTLIKDTTLLKKLLSCARACTSPSWKNVLMITSPVSGQTCGQTNFYGIFTAKNRKTKSAKTLIKSRDLTLFFLVEVWRFELQASSTRTRKNMFFEHFCLHIVRIFRGIISFCTFVPFIPYRTFPVVVSYVVKLKIRLKAENGELGKAFSPH